jgi:hypothetical protein
VQLRRIEASKEVYLIIIIIRLPLLDVLFRQIANTIVSSGNKVFLSADSLMINALGDSYLDTREDETVAPVTKKAGYLW